MIGAAPALAARDLTVGYAGRRSTRAVLEHVSLGASRGELVCLLGPNGIGKSTLLRTLAGMQPALAGRVQLDNHDVRSLTPGELARRLAVVLTDRGVIDGLTARRVVELGRHPHIGWFGVLREHDRAAVAAALAAVGASRFAEADMSRLSDGERQRVMIARALAQHPSVLLLDEPTAFLDIGHEMTVFELLVALARDGQAVLLVSHNLNLVARFAQRIVLLESGRVVAAGDPTTVMRPETLERVYGWPIAVAADPTTGTPTLIPLRSSPPTH